MKKWTIYGGRILTPHESLKNRNIHIVNDRIQKISSEKQSASLQLDLRDCVVVPGLINAHDHLLGTYHPKIGKGPYVNWLPWDNDLKSSPLYQERQQIENRDLYLLGAYRNLVSGVTTVSDHMPHFVGDPFYPSLPMKAIKDFTLVHSVNSFALLWGDDIGVEYRRALELDVPFVTHCAEGFDEETARDVQTLNRHGGLGDHTVMVHCIAFSQEDMKLVKARGASCVWCADSNVFMYNETADVKMLLDMGINTCIGTDSSATGGENLLAEIAFDKALYDRIYGVELPDQTIVKMITANPAKAFRLKTLGEVKEGFTADLTVFSDRGGHPSSSVVGAGLNDIRLVVIDGLPAYGDAEFEWLFEKLGVKCQHIVLDGTERVIIGDCKGLLRRISRSVGFKKEFPFLPVEFEIA